MISPCSWKQSSILSDITKRAEISAIRKYKGKTAQSQVLLGWTLPRANSPTYETIHPRELILMINLPFEYAEKQHFKISSSDLIPSLGQKTAEQSAGVEVRDLTVLRLIYWAMPAHLLLWLQTKLSWHSRQLTLPQQGQVWVRELLITSTQNSFSFFTCAQLETAPSSTLPSLIHVLTQQDNTSTPFNFEARWEGQKIYQHLPLEIISHLSESQTSTQRWSWGLQIFPLYIRILWAGKENPPPFWATLIFEVTSNPNQSGIISSVNSQLQ